MQTAKSVFFGTQGYAKGAVSIGILCFSIILFTVLAIGINLYPTTYADAGSTIFIDNETDFANFIGSDTNVSYDVQLTNDIYLYNYELAQSTYLISKFTGTFDGNGHSLIGLNTNENISLFGEITSESIVENVNIVGFSFSLPTSSGAVAVIAQSNKGHIKNVKIYANVDASRVIGVSLTNSGIIEDCFIYLSLSQNVDLLQSYGVVERNFILLGSDPTSLSIESGTIENTVYIIKQNNEFESGVLPSLEFLEDIEVEDITLSKEALNGTVLGINDPYIDDGLISDLFDILYWDSQGALQSVVQNEEINFYNLSDLDFNFNTNYSREYGFYNYLGVSNFDGYPSSGTIDNTASIALDGAGTQNSPYLIKSYADWNYVGEIMVDLTTPDAIKKACYSLVKSIYLFQPSSTTIYEMRMDSFYGILNGGGYSIVGASNTTQALIGRLETGGVVKNLYLKTTAPSGEGVLIESNYGTVSNCTFDVKTNDYIDLTAGIVKNNYGNISACTVSLRGIDNANFYPIAVNNYSSISKVRNESTLCPVKTNAGSIIASQSNAPIWSEGGAGSVSQSISKLSSGYVSTEVVAVNSFIYNNQDSWGIIAGEDFDIPLLVFPKDNVSFKTINKLNMHDYITGYTGESILGYSEINGYPVIELLDILTDLDDREGYKFYLIDGIKNSEIVASTVILERGQYIIEGRYIPTDSQTGVTVSSTVTITTVEIIVTIDDYQTMPGVDYSNFPLRESLFYDEQKTYTADWFRMSLPQEIQITLAVNHYDTYYGQGKNGVNIVHNAGIYQLLLTAIDPNGNYDIKFQFSKSDTINPSLLTFKIKPINGVISVIANNIDYDQEPSVRYTFTKENGIPPVNDVYDVAAVSFSTSYTKGNNVGEYSIVAIQKSGYHISDNYVFLAGAGTSFTVYPISIPGISDVRFVDVNTIYNGSEYAIVPTGIPAGLTAIYSKEKYTNAGRYIYSLNIPSSSKNYNSFGPIYAELTITPATINVVAKSHEINFPEIPVIAGVEYSIQGYATSPPGIDTSKIFELKCDYPVNHAVGEYAITIVKSPLMFTSTLARDNYYYDLNAIVFTPGKLTVNRGEWNLALTNQEVNYSGYAYLPELTTNGVNLLSLVGFNIEYYKYASNGILETNPLSGAPSKAGEYKINISRPLSQNYLSTTYTEDFFIYKLDFNLPTVNLVSVTNSNGGTTEITEQELVVLPYNAGEYRIELSNNFKESILNSMLSPNDIISILVTVYVSGIQESYTLIAGKSIGIPEIPIKTVNVAFFSGISITISGDNYLTITRNVFSQIVVAERYLRLKEYQLERTYDTQDYIYEPEFRAGFDVIDGDDAGVTYSVTVSNIEAASMKNTGTYEITLEIRNTNYAFESMSNKLLLVIKKCEVTLDLSEMKEISFGYGTYGNVIPVANYSYKVGAFTETGQMRFVINAPNDALPSIYDIVAAEEKANVRFNILHGDNKVEIAKKTLFFDWQPEGQSWYFQSVLIFDNSVHYGSRIIVEESYWASQKVSLIPHTIGAVITIDRDVKNVGTYIATLSIEGSPQRYYINTKYEIMVEKATAEFVIEDSNMIYAHELPVFSGQLNSSSYENEEGAYSVTEWIVEEYTEMDGIPGTYIISAILASQNYEIVVITGVLTVVKGVFSASLSNKQMVYGSPYTPAVNEILPDATTIESTHFGILDVGVYNVSITLKNEYYTDLNLSAQVEVLQAMPDTIIMKSDERCLYNGDASLPAPTGKVFFNSSEVEGIFLYSTAPVPIFGISNYMVTFLPLSNNYSMVSDIPFSVEFYIENSIILITLDGEDISTTQREISLAEADTIVITFNQEDLFSEALMYVNDEAVEGNVLTIDEDGEYSIDIRLNNVKVASRDIKVLKVKTPTEEPNSEDGGNEWPTEKKDKDTRNLVVLIVSIVGGVILIIVAIILTKRIVVTRKKKN
ncbi:MAG: hypothetical protein LBU04_05805 [Christensenellaceae bacterium]|jgi:hypothetical protein|nr:hypothetical protein [Christensenellaceae bacterium]